MHRPLTVIGGRNKEINMQNKSKSIETMKGVFLSSKEGYQSEIKDYSLTILIEDPFNAKISIEIDTDEWNKYVNYRFERNWRGSLDSHPQNSNNDDFYFNLQEGKFYMASIDKGDLIWQESTLRNIVNVSYLAWRFRRHIHTEFNRYHAGQQCEFQAYAIDTNENLYKPSSIKKDFHEYQWKFYPTTFKAHEISEKTIKYLVEKTPIPKETTDEMVRHHQEQDKAKQQKEKDDRKTSRKEQRSIVLGNINTHFERYQHFYRYGVIGGILWLIGIIIAIILA